VASGERLKAVAHGEVEADDGVLVLRRVHVVFTLSGVSPDKVETAERAHGAFKSKCPVYRSLHRAIEITTELHVQG
jgi:uncharacterized OsmC-like protein